jgi:signal transduction histidine kinase
MAVLAVAVVTLVRLELQPILGEYARFLPFVLAVMFSAWYGGLKPGLLATALSAVTVLFLFITPAEHPSALTLPRDAVQIGLFCIVGGMVSVLSGALKAEVVERRRAEQASKAQTRALVDVIERLAQEPDLERLQGLVLSSIVNQLEGDGGELWSHDPDSQTARMVLDYREGRVATAKSAGHPLSCPETGCPSIAGWERPRANLSRGECFLIPDLEGDSCLPDRVRRGLLQMGMRSLLVVPMLSQGRLVGFYTVRNSRPKSYGPGEIQLAQALAHQVTLAMTFTRLAGQAQQAAVLKEQEQAAARRLAELSSANRALLRTLGALAAEPQLDEFLGTVVASITGQLKAVSSSLWLFDDEARTATLHLAYHDGRVLTGAESGYPQTAFSLDDFASHPSWVTLLRERRPWVHQVDTATSIPPALRDYLVAQGVKTTMSFPLALGERIIGLFNVRFETEAPIAPEKLELAHALAHYATMAIQMARLADQARQTAVLNERNRMAREIHDTLAQTFTAILAQLAAAERLLDREPQRREAHLQTARVLACQGLAEARRSVYALRPQALEETDLAGALARMTEQLTADHATQIRFRLSGMPRPLPPDAAGHLLRIGQEAATNAVRHAQASEIGVELAFEEGDLRLSVEDDGTGFVVNDLRRAEGFGLITLQERARILGADLAIASQPGGGTRVQLNWPLPADLVARSEERAEVAAS